MGKFYHIIKIIITTIIMQGSLTITLTGELCMTTAGGRLLLRKNFMDVQIRGSRISTHQLRCYICRMIMTVYRDSLRGTHSLLTIKN